MESWLLLVENSVEGQHLYDGDMGHRGASGGQRWRWATFGHDRHFIAKALAVTVRLSLCWGGGGEGG